MCLMRSTGSDLKFLIDYVNGDTDFRGRIVQDRVTAIRKEREVIIELASSLEDQLDGLAYLAREGIKAPPDLQCDTCEMSRSTAGDTSSSCGICGNLRPDLEYWIHRSIMFQAQWSGVEKSGALDHDMFAPYYVRGPKKVSK